MKKWKQFSVCLLAFSLVLPAYTWDLHAEENTSEIEERTIENNETIHYRLRDEVLENVMRVSVPFDSSIMDYKVTWSVKSDVEFHEDTTPVYFRNADTERVSSITTEFNTVDVYFHAPGTAVIEVQACKADKKDCLPSKQFYVDVVNPTLAFTQDIVEYRYVQDHDTLFLKLNEKDEKHWQDYYDITWAVADTDIARLYDTVNDRYTNLLKHATGTASLQSVAKGKTKVRVDIVNKKNTNIKAFAIIDVYVKDILSDMTLFINDEDIRVEVGSFLPYYTDPESTISIQNTVVNDGVAVGFKDGRGQVNFDTYRDLIKMRIGDETIIRRTAYVKYNGMSIPLEQASEEAKKGQVFYAFEALKPGTTTVAFSYGKKVITTKIRVSEKLNNDVELDPSGDIGKDEINFTVSDEAIQQANADTKANVRLNLTKSAIDSLIMSSKNKNIAVNIAIPESVRRKANIEQILISSNTMEAARNYKKNMNFQVTNESAKLLYGWSFQASDIKDLGYDLNLAISKRMIKEVYKIDALAQDTRATVVNFHHEGSLPGNAKIRLYVGDMGYAAHETLYLYFYDEINDKLNDEQGKENGYVVDDALYIEFPITHCSNYVLTTKALSEKELAVKTPALVKEDTSGVNFQESSGNVVGSTGADANMRKTMILVLAILMLCEVGYIIAKKKHELAK